MPFSARIFRVGDRTRGDIALASKLTTGIDAFAPMYPLCRVCLPP